MTITEKEKLKQLYNIQLIKPKYVYIRIYILMANCQKLLIINQKVAMLNKQRNSNKNHMMII